MAMRMKEVTVSVSERRIASHRRGAIGRFISIDSPRSP
jgi:hypothetical protein